MVRHTITQIMCFQNGENQNKKLCKLATIFFTNGSKYTMFKITVIILLFLILFTQCMGCVAVPGVVSAVAIPATESYTTYRAITTTKAAVDVTLAMNDKKTTNDMMLSSVTGKDCKLQDTFKKGTICESISNR